MIDRKLIKYAVDRNDYSVAIELNDASYVEYCRDYQKTLNLKRNLLKLSKSGLVDQIRIENIDRRIELYKELLEKICDSGEILINGKLNTLGGNQ